MKTSRPVKIREADQTVKQQRSRLSRVSGRPTPLRSDRFSANSDVAPGQSQRPKLAFGAHDPKKRTFVPSSTALQALSLIVGVPLRGELALRRITARALGRGADRCESHISFRR